MGNGRIQPIRAGGEPITAGMFDEIYRRLNRMTTISGGDGNDVTQAGGTVNVQSNRPDPVNDLDALVYFVFNDNNAANMNLSTPLTKLGKGFFWAMLMIPNSSLFSRATNKDVDVSMLGSLVEEGQVTQPWVVVWCADKIEPGKGSIRHVRWLGFNEIGIPLYFSQGGSGGGTTALTLGSNATRYGVYNVTELTKPTTDVPTGSGTFSAGDLGGTGGAALLYNLAEIGQTSHDLTSASPAIVLVTATLWYVNSDGTKIYVGYIIGPGCEAGA